MLRQARCTNDEAVVCGDGSVMTDRDRVTAMWLTAIG